MIEIEEQQLSSFQADELARTRIQFQIPQKYHREPIICNLILNYDLQVNLRSAILGKDGLGGGCFDLELQGNRQKIDGAIDYLSQLNVEIWQRTDGDATSW